jgi:hypothetical protein
MRVNFSFRVATDDNLKPIHMANLRAHLRAVLMVSRGDCANLGLAPGLGEIWKPIINNGLAPYVGLGNFVNTDLLD